MEINWAVKVPMIWLNYCCSTVKGPTLKSKTKFKPRTNSRHKKVSISDRRRGSRSFVLSSIALLRVQQGLPAELTEEERKAKKKKTKKKKKKKKKSLDDTPPFGPLVTKIHLFDNEIDCLQPDGLSIVQRTIQAYARFALVSLVKQSIAFDLRRLIEISEDLEELDLDENVIGHVSASLILHALKSRKESE